MNNQSDRCPECGSTQVDYIGQLDNAASFADEELAVAMSCDTCGTRYAAVYAFDRCELKGRRIA